MARAGNNNFKGSVRVMVVDGDPPVASFVPTTNSGPFQSIERIDVGEYDVAMNDNFLLKPEEVVQPQIEGVTLGAPTINIANQGLFKVRTFNIAGEPEDLPFSLRIVEVFRG